MTGDGTLVARVASVDNVDPWTKAGVVMRDALSAGCAHAFMLVGPGTGLAFQRRVTSGGVSTSTAGGSGTAPAWVKLTRAGDVFTALPVSRRLHLDAGWQRNDVMAPSVQVGLLVSSRRDGTPATARFEDVAVTP